MNDWRTEVIEAGARALPRYGAWAQMLPIDIAAAVVDAVAPIIRADEAAKSDKLAEVCGQLLADRERLRAQVEALPSWEVLGSELLLRSDVLALLDGAQ